jgi:two-component system, sensor histidine kinase and response regulator
MTEPQILIVDDDPALLEALPQALQLRIQELRADTCNSALSALEHIAATDYDALVVDIKMPGIDGLELLSEIKKRRPDTPTLLITGHGDHELAVQALRGGAYDYVTKPIDREYFAEALRRAIECHRLGRDVAERRQDLLRQADELEKCVQERTLELREALHKEQVLRAELDQAKSALEAMSRQREAFISMIAHDLAAPLTTVRGYAELLGRPAVSEELRGRACKTIVAETRRMARLTEDLADAARLATGQFGIRVDSCDLVEIARQEVELAAQSADQHVIVLDAPRELVLQCDPDRMGQIFANLLTNAIKHTPAGHIRVRVWREGDEARVSVSDDGPGIPPDQAEHIFEAGRRLSQGGTGTHSNGSGLGLHIARGIAEAHGGRLWVDSNAEQGATFVLTLPLAAAPVGRRHT